MKYLSIVLRHYSYDIALRYTSFNEKFMVFGFNGAHLHLKNCNFEVVCGYNIILLWSYKKSLEFFKYGRKHITSFFITYHHPSFFSAFVLSPFFYQTYQVIILSYSKSSQNCYLPNEQLITNDGDCQHHSSVTAFGATLLSRHEVSLNVYACIRSAKYKHAVPVLFHRCKNA